MPRTARSARRRQGWPIDSGFLSLTSLCLNAYPFSTPDYRRIVTAPLGPSAYEGHAITLYMAGTCDGRERYYLSPFHCAQVVTARG